MTTFRLALVTCLGLVASLSASIVASLAASAAAWERTRADATSWRILSSRAAVSAVTWCWEAKASAMAPCRRLNSGIWMPTVPPTRRSVPSSWP